MKRIAYTCLAIFLVVSCSEEQKADVVKSPGAAEGVESPLAVSEPMAFPDVDSLNEYGWNATPQSKSLDGFVSFAESVMREEDYDDRPNAIMSSRFGSVLNSEGEVIVAGYFLKLTDFGILLGDIQAKETIRELANDSHTVSLCGEKICLETINPYKKVSRLCGYDNIFFYDLFSLMEDAAGENESVETRSPASNLVVYDKTLADLNLLMDPYADFTVPPSGSQKVLYDEKHCNDTKIWQKDYLVTIDRGLKTKTMKKSGAIWSKYQNPLEGGILNWVIQEDGQFGAIYGTVVDINKVKYGDRNPDPEQIVYTVNARGLTLGNIMSQNLQQYISAGNAVASSYGLGVSVTGVRFVVSDNLAYTRFPDRVESGNVKKIEKDFPSLFAGYATGKQSYILNSSALKGHYGYVALSAQIYGQSSWGTTYRGSKMTYHRF